MQAATQVTTAVMAAVFCLAGVVQGQSMKTSGFDGKTLAGWQQEGGLWSVENGNIVGRPADTDAGAWLKLNQRYEDFMVRFSFKCVACQAGLIFRAANDGDGTGGTYISLAGSDIAAVSRINLDARGVETAHKVIGAPAGQDKTPVQIMLRPDGWNEVTIFVRGNLLEGLFDDRRLRPMKIDDPKFDKMNQYGSIALHVAGGKNATLMVRNVTLEDLTFSDALPLEHIGPNFRERRVTDLYYSEGVAAGDLNHDGKKDVVAGAFYYLGPDFKVAREIYPSQTYNPSTKNNGTYTDSFLQYVYDFNGDGWPDVLKINFEGAWLYINPRDENRHWDVYEVVHKIAAETTQLADLDGDGKPELLLSQGSADETQYGYAKPNWSDPTKPWKVTFISDKSDRGPHGLGVGDVNGDGRMDVLQASGWWEQPLAGTSGLWKFHPVADFGGGPDTGMERPFAGGADMFVYDVNNDGRPDVITSLGAHGCGLVWMEQIPDGAGESTWKKHLIMGNPADPMSARSEWEETDKSVAFCELHALAFADMDGDGLKDIVTGKRWWSHGDNFGSPDAQAAPMLYWFALQRTGGNVSFVPHLIHNNSGVGTQLVVTDMNGDQRPDVLTSARKGTFIFFNDVTHKTAVKPVASAAK